MKYIFSLVILMLSVTAFDSACSSDTNNDRVSIKEINFENDSNTLSLIFEIKNILPIDWGTTYRCKIFHENQEIGSNIGQEIILYVSVGSEDKFPEKDIHALNIQPTYIGQFYRAEKNEKHYMPAGTTGFVDKDGFICLMISLKEYQK